MTNSRKYDYPDELYKHGSFFWQPVFLTTDRFGRCLNRLKGPLCVSCKASVKSQDENHSTEAECLNCSRKFQLKFPINLLREKAYIALQAKLKENFKIISLELPPDAIVDRDENEKYWIEARLGQKNGKLMGLVYMGEKLPNQSKKDYVQMFVDIDDQQIRFDKGNKNPLKLLSKIEVEFEDSEAMIKKK